MLMKLNRIEKTSRAAPRTGACLALLLTLGAWQVPAAAGEADDAGRASLARMPKGELPGIPEVAHERMRYLNGRWKVRTEFLDPNGKVIQTTNYLSEAHWLIQDRVVLLTHDAPEQGVLSKAMVFWSTDDKKFELVDVNQKGELWFLSGDLDEEVFTSAPKKMPNGRDIILKFTHFNIQPETFEVYMEYSYDDGATWTRGQHQHASRIR